MAINTATSSRDQIPYRIVALMKRFIFSLLKKDVRDFIRALNECYLQASALSAPVLL